MFEAILFLFPSLVACITILLILGYLGLHVLEREIIFIDIALAQVAVTGSTLAFILYRQESHGENGITARIFAIIFVLIASAFFSFAAKKVSQISQETVIGVSYAIAAAATLFLLATAAGSDIHMEEMLTGSILWAQWSDILHCTVVYAVIGMFHYIFRKKFIELSFNYKNAADTGMNVMWWDFLFYTSMGIVITYTIELSGVLLTFSFLIIPATFSALFTSRLKRRLIITWLSGTLISAVGLLFSYRFDFSGGPSIISFLGLFLILGALYTKTFPGIAEEIDR